jgi:hypothetical protein
VKNLGRPEAAYIHGMIRQSNPGAPVFLTIFGNNLDQEYLQSLLAKCSHLLHRPVQGNILNIHDEESFLTDNPDALMIWRSNREF